MWQLTHAFGSLEKYDSPSAQEEFQAVMFSATSLAPGTHTLSIEVLGTRNAAAGGTRIVIDAFDVIR